MKKKILRSVHKVTKSNAESSLLMLIVGGNEEDDEFDMTVGVLQEILLEEKFEHM